MITMHTRPRQTDRQTNVMAILRRYVLTNALYTRNHSGVIHRMIFLLHVFIRLLLIDGVLIITFILALALLPHTDCDTMVLLAGQQTCDSLIAGSSPGWAPLRSGLGQATYTCVPLSPSSIIWYWLGGDLFGWESNHGPSRK